jgi:hypothetical protein
VGWLQSFCDSLVESSLQGSVLLVNKKRKADEDARPAGASAEAAADATVPDLSAIASSMGEALNALAADGLRASPTGASSTPRASHAFAFTPSRGTPFGGKNLLNELMQFDVDELLKIVAAAGHSLVLASPRNKPLVSVSPNTSNRLAAACGDVVAAADELVGISSAQRLASAHNVHFAAGGGGASGLPPAGSRLGQLSHKLFLSPRTAQQLAPPPPLGAADEPNAKPAASLFAPPSVTPRRRGTITAAMLSVSGKTPRHVSMTPMTPGSARISSDDMLGFLNLDALLTPSVVHGAHSSGEGGLLHGLLGLSPFPLAPMPTPTKAEVVADLLAKAAQSPPLARSLELAVGNAVVSKAALRMEGAAAAAHTLAQADTTPELLCEEQLLDC